jgi:serine/threonine protein kinase
VRTNKYYAIKIVKRHKVESISLSKFKRILSNEVALLASMKHESIIKLVEFNLNGEVVVKPCGKCIQIFFIVLEHLEQGDLFSLIEKGAFPERVARFYFK